MSTPASTLHPAEEHTAGGEQWQHRPLQVRFEASTGTPASSGSSDQDEACQVPTAIRYGVAADQGGRAAMEDASVAVEGLLGAEAANGAAEQASIGAKPLLTALFAVFDGHNGIQAATFAAERILAGLLDSSSFPAQTWAEKDSPKAVGVALYQAFLQIDRDYYTATSGAGSSAGTTALAAVVWGSHVVVANAGDSRAVMGRRGKAIQLTRDHKPHVLSERERIEASGGFVCDDGLLCGELGVARAIGDYHLPELKTPPSALSSAPVSRTSSATTVVASRTSSAVTAVPSSAATAAPSRASSVVTAAGIATGTVLAAAAQECCSWGEDVLLSGPLTAAPEVTVHELEASDEFMVLGCDGLWDVMHSQRAIEFARQRLREHNDPGRCAQELVTEALRMHTTDNVTVIVVCFGTEPPQRRVYGGVSRNHSRSGVKEEASSRLSFEQVRLDG